MESAPTSAVLASPPATSAAVPPPGWKSSEFIVTILLIAGNLVTALAGVLPATWAGGLSLATGAIYKVTRLILKLRTASLGVDQVLGLADVTASGARATATTALADILKTVTSAPDAAATASATSTASAPAPVIPAAPAPSQAGFITPGLLAIAAALSALAILCFGGCAVNGAAVKTHLVSLANAEGKEVVHLLGSATDRAAAEETARLNSAIEGALK